MKKMKLFLLASAVVTAFSAMALRATMVTHTYIDANGYEIGGKIFSCTGNVYSWGTSEGAVAIETEEESCRPERP